MAPLPALALPLLLALAPTALLAEDAPAATAPPNGAAVAAPEDPTDAVRCQGATEVPRGAPMVCHGRLSADGPEIEVRLFWQVSAYGDQAEIDRLEIFLDGAEEPSQSFDDIDSVAFFEQPANGFELIDLNFDGWRDMRLIAFVPAGPNLPYLTWLWDPAAERFVRTETLDEIANATPLPDRQEIMGFWRVAPNSYVTQGFRWNDEALEPVWRAVETYSRAEGSDDTVCERLRSHWTGSAWAVDGTEPCY